MLSILKNRRRKRLTSLPFPPDWLNIIHKNVALYFYLPPEDQQELQKHVQVFLSEKQFEGCGGLTVTQTIKVTIAAQACFLLLRRKTDYFPHLTSILMYPSSYVVPVKEYIGHGVVSEGHKILEGEAFRDDVIVLSWEDAYRNSVNPGGGKNVVLHEFAHQLDMEDGQADGVPLLPSPRLYPLWSKVLTEEYESLQYNAENYIPTVIDTYGATDPAEFFAVATECFFLRAKRLQQSHPQLYQLLREYYRQDPAQYFKPLDEW